MPDFVVVGGGIGGLVVARRLAKAGKSVTLVEARDHLGGTVARQNVGGLDLDAGAESFALRGGTVAQLATELGLGNEIVSPTPGGAWLQPSTGDAKPLPRMSLMGIPGSPLAQDVIDILGTGPAFRAFAEALLPGTYGAESVSLGELVERRMGTAVLENLVAPIVRGVHSIEPHDLELDRVAPGLRAALRRTGSLARAVRETRASATKAGSAVAGIRGGINRLVDELAVDLSTYGVTVLFNAPASDVMPDSVVVDGERLEGRVIVAAPGLLGAPAGAGHLAVLTTLVVDAPQLDSAPRGTGVLVAAGANGIRARALTHSTAKWPWLAERAEGKHVVRLSYGSALDNHSEVAREDAARLLGVSLPPSSVLDYARVRWTRPERETHTPDGISLVGETAAGTGLAAVIAQAEAEALALLRNFDE
jgi:oxygen-dependent protoporphyrinogen oxidase